MSKAGKGKPDGFSLRQWTTDEFGHSLASEEDRRRAGIFALRSGRSAKERKMFLEMLGIDPAELEEGLQ